MYILAGSHEIQHRPHHIRLERSHTRPRAQVLTQPHREREAPCPNTIRSTSEKIQHHPHHLRLERSHARPRTQALAQPHREGDAACSQVARGSYEIQHHPHHIRLQRSHTRCRTQPLPQPHGEGDAACSARRHRPQQRRNLHRKVNVRLPGQGDSNSHGARPVHLIITMIKWIRTSRLSIKKSLSARRVATARSSAATFTAQARIRLIHG